MKRTTNYGVVIIADGQTEVSSARAPLQESARQIESRKTSNLAVGKGASGVSSIDMEWAPPLKLQAFQFRGEPQS